MSENVIEGRYHPRAGGQDEEWELLLDGAKLNPARSQAVLNHSPDGFAWGYGGSAPAQAGLAILLAVTNDEEVAERLHHAFTAEVLSGQEMHSDFTTTIDVAHWVEEMQREAATLG